MALLLRLKINNINALYLGNFIPWDVRKQVKIIKDELGWEGDEVEGIPPEYDYEKIECMMQGMRDFLKYSKPVLNRLVNFSFLKYDSIVLVPSY